MRAETTNGTGRPVFVRLGDPDAALISELFQRCSQFIELVYHRPLRASDGAELLEARPPDVCE
jgi:hypothetical protein